MPGGQINDPSSGKHCSPPATPSSPSRTLEGLFELTRRLSRALDSPRALLPELQRYKDTVRCAALGAEVPGHRQEQLTQTLIVCLFKTHFFTPILDCKKSTEFNCVTRPEGWCFPPGPQLSRGSDRCRQWPGPPGSRRRWQHSQQSAAVCNKIIACNLLKLETFL